MRNTYVIIVHKQSVIVITKSVDLRHAPIGALHTGGIAVVFVLVAAAIASVVALLILNFFYCC